MKVSIDLSIPVRTVREEGCTMSLGETGTFSASAISCALALTLALRPLIVLMASLRLFCRPCLVFVVLATPLVQSEYFSFRGCHQSFGNSPLAVPFCLLGIGDLDMACPSDSSQKVCNVSGGEARGNLNVERSDDEDCRSAPVMEPGILT